MNKASIDEVPAGAMATPALSCMGRECQKGAMVMLERRAETCEIPADEEEGNCPPWAPSLKKPRPPLHPVPLGRAGLAAVSSPKPSPCSCYLGRGTLNRVPPPLAQPVCWPIVVLYTSLLNRRRHLFASSDGNFISKALASD